MRKTRAESPYRENYRSPYGKTRAGFIDQWSDFNDEEHRTFILTSMYAIEKELDELRPLKQYFEVMQNLVEQQRKTIDQLTDVIEMQGKKT